MKHLELILTDCTHEVSVSYVHKQGGSYEASVTDLCVSSNPDLQVSAGLNLGETCCCYSGLFAFRVLKAKVSLSDPFLFCINKTDIYVTW